MLKTLDTSSATTWVEKVEKQKKKVTFLEVINKPIIFKFLKDFTNQDETFKKSWKQDSFRHTLKSSASIYESSDSPFSRTTIGIQNLTLESGPDAFHESSLVLTFFNWLGSQRDIVQFRISSWNSWTIKIVVFRKVFS